MWSLDVTSILTILLYIESLQLPSSLLTQGTQVYDAQKGAFVDLGILDVLQIFGRAGRPQYHSEGEGIIITSHDKLAHYLSLITRQCPIESKFTDSLTDNLNAEVCSRHLCLSLCCVARSV